MQQQDCWGRGLTRPPQQVSAFLHMMRRHRNPTSTSTLLLLLLVVLGCGSGAAAAAVPTLPTPMLLNSGMLPPLTPAALKSRGYTHQLVGSAGPLCSYRWLDPTIFANRTQEAWRQAQVDDMRRDLGTLAASGLQALSGMDIFVLPEQLYNKYKANLTHSSSGGGSLPALRGDTQPPIRLNNFTLALMEGMLDEIFTELLPGLGGISVRVGENYGGPQGPVAWVGNGAVDFHQSFAEQQAEYALFINRLRQVVCVKHGRTLMFRTWDTSGFSPADPPRFHPSLAYYLNVTNQVPPHPLLIFSIKHVALDFWRYVGFNPALTRGQHQQLVEVECAREYEGKGALPAVVTRGVIEGFPELPAANQTGLRDIIGDARIQGLWTWSQGGGWFGPAIGQQTLWPYLNTIVTAEWFLAALEARKAGAAPPSEQAAFLAACASAGLNTASGADCGRLHNLSLASLPAVAGLRHSVAYDTEMFQRGLMPINNWLRDDRLSGLQALGDHSFSGNPGAIAWLYNTSQLDEALEEKHAAVELWTEMVGVAQSIEGAGLRDEAVTTVVYGQKLAAVAAWGWEALAQGYRGQRSGRTNTSALCAAIASYDAAWEDYNASLASHPLAATPFHPYYEGGNLESKIEPGLDASIAVFRNSCRGREVPAQTPTQVLVAWGEAPGSMAVSWAVEGGAGFSDSMSLTPCVWWREEGGWEWTGVNASTVIAVRADLTAVHAVLDGLPTGAVVAVRVGWWETGANASSATPTRLVRTLTAQGFPASNRTVTRLALFGDLGWTDNQILPYLAADVQAQAVDGIVLYGDMVYWWNTEGGAASDSFMRDLSRMSGGGVEGEGGWAVPVMVSPGNGESWKNFSDYRMRFRMPGWAEAENLWYSVDVGHAHVIALNTEALGYWPSMGPDVLKRMLDWLESDLQAATAPERRAQRPWIVVHQHRPTYSSWGDPESDSKPQQYFEQVMYDYGVDVVFAGHVHNHELTKPVFLGEVRGGGGYDDSAAPVYVVAGNPGNAEETSFFVDARAWTDWRSFMFGYARAEFNATHFGVELLSTQLGGQVVRQQWLTKSRPCNFGAKCGGVEGLRGGGEGGEEIPVRVVGRWRDEEDARAGAEVPAEQTAALLQLFAATGGESRWRQRRGWKEGSDPCADRWYGVSCIRDVDQHVHIGGGAVGYGVTAVQLASNGLAGEIGGGVDWAALAPTLQLLDLSSNALEGGLPMGLWAQAMPQLHTLYLSPWQQGEASLAGELPAGLGVVMPRLKYLGLDRLQLVGAVPPSLGRLNCTVVNAGVDNVACLVWLFNNKLSGVVSSELCNATFAEIYLKSNNLTCPYPCLHYGYASMDECAEKCVPCP